jgi:predicted negative regulator of RcsB-dependent stress response
VDRQTRKDLKTDKFAVEAGHMFEFLTEHPDDVKRYGVIAVAVVILVAGVYFYRNHQATAREEALAQAMKIEDSQVSNNPVPPNITYKTVEEKDQAWNKAFSDLASKYRGSREGAIGGIFLAAKAADKGNLPEAEKLYKDIVDSAPSDFASMASLSLANVYAAEGKQAEAEKLLRDLVKNPTTLVSKEEASIELAGVLIKTNPTEARKVLEPLRIGRSAVSRAAVTMLGNIPQNN